MKIRFLVQKNHKTTIAISQKYHSTGALYLWWSPDTCYSLFSAPPQNLMFGQFALSIADWHKSLFKKGSNRPLSSSYTQQENIKLSEVSVENKSRDYVRLHFNIYFQSNPTYFRDYVLSSYWEIKKKKKETNISQKQLSFQLLTASF